jgi:hypothetical protein
MFKRATQPVKNNGNAFTIYRIAILSRLGFYPWGLQFICIMYPRKKFDGDPVWKYEELPPAALIKSLHLEPATIDQDEFWRAEWFWSRRPKVLSESVSLFFFYLIVAVCLSISFRAPSRFSFSGSLQGRVAPLSMVFISTGGERNTSQVLHGSLFICQNENKALGIHCRVCLSQLATVKNNRRPHVRTDVEAVFRFLC